MIRKIISILAGTALFFVLTGVIAGILVKLGITPFGEFVNTMAEKGSLQKSGEFMVSDKGVSMGLRAVTFQRFFILPLISVIAGFFTGWIAGNKGWLCGIISAGPAVILIAGYDSLAAVFSVIVSISLAAGGGYAANRIKAGTLNECGECE